MTVLQRTNLTTSQKIQCAAAAVAGQHAHGSKTALSETYEISRPTVYAVGAAESVLRKSISEEVVADGCLLCSEDKPHHCHRRLVAEYLNDHWGGVEIAHLG